MPRATPRRPRADPGAGTERLMEMAEAMRADFDTDFCNYLNFAIEKARAEIAPRRRDA